jgi:hypothetical protein
MNMRRPKHFFAWLLDQGARHVTEAQTATMKGIAMENHFGKQPCCGFASQMCGDQISHLCS